MSNNTFLAEHTSLADAMIDAMHEIYLSGLIIKGMIDAQQEENKNIGISAVLDWQHRRIVDLEQLINKQLKM